MKPGGKRLARKVHQYAAELQATIACVANDAVRLGCEPGPLATGGSGYKISLLPLELLAPADADPVQFMFGQLVEPAEEHLHGFTVTKYWYIATDEHGDPRLRWEWDSEQDPSWPHLHVDRLDDATGESTTLWGRQMDKLHLATGRVLLEDILEMMIRDGIVVPVPGADIEAARATSLAWARAASWGSLRSD